MCYAKKKEIEDGSKIKGTVSVRIVYYTYPWSTVTRHQQIYSIFVENFFLRSFTEIGRV